VNDVIDGEVGVELYDDRAGRTIYSQNGVVYVQWGCSRRIILLGFLNESDATLITSADAVEDESDEIIDLQARLANMIDVDDDDRAFRLLRTIAVNEGTLNASYQIINY